MAEGTQLLQNKPRRDRPQMPKDYGVPDDEQSMLSWEETEKQLEEAHNYWIGTVRPNGRPHASPVWAVWLDNHLYFDGSPETRRHRNLAANPNMVAHLESGSNVVIVEGEAHQVEKPPRALTSRVAAAYRKKYTESGYAPTDDQWDEGGLYEMKPRVALAWTQFPTNCTRWHFD